jgi:drug/metabolite transporter (DMT)-like permease
MNLFSKLSNNWQAFILKFHLSKTLLAAAFIAALGVVEMNWSLLNTVIPEKYRGVGFVIVAAVMAVMRVYTTKSLSAK